VRLPLRGAVAELTERFDAVFARGGTGQSPARPAMPAFLSDDPSPAGHASAALAGPAVPAPGDLLAGAEDEIDRLFA